MLWHLAMLRRDGGWPGDAAALLERSLAITREVDDRRGQAQILLELGKVRTDEGRLEEADALLASSMEAWPLATEHPGFRAKALHALAQLRFRQRRLDQAADYFTRAAILWQGLGAQALQALSLTALGDTLTAAGQRKEAHAARQRALALRRRQDPPEQASTATQLRPGRDDA